MPPSVCDDAPGAVIGRLFSAFSESDLVLRRLHHDRVGHAVVGIEPVGRRDLAGAREIDHHAVGDVALGQADILGAGAVDVDVEARRVERLLDARIDQPRHVPELLQEFLRVGIIGGEVGAADLQVDRRRRAEVQDLRDDVGRQERERHAGEAPRQLLAQQADVFGGRPVVFLELDLDVAVLRADRAGGVVGHVDAADREADVVDQGVELGGRDELADRLLDFGELVGAFLDPGADLDAGVHQDLPGVDGGEEVAAEERHQRERRQHEGHEADDEDRPAAQRHRPAARDSPRGCARTGARSRAGSAPADCASAAAGRRGRACRCAARACAAGSSPWSAPACATG